MSKMLTGGAGLNAEYVTVPVAVEATLSAGLAEQAKTSVDPATVVVSVGHVVYRLAAPRAAEGTGQLSAPPAGVTPRRHTSSPERPNKGMFTREERPMHDFRQSHRRSTLWSTRRHAGRDARSLSRRAEELA